MSNTPMTPTPEGKQLAADLANAVRRERGEHTIWDGGYFEARYGTVHEAFARLATEHLALKAKHEEALADLREIDRIAVSGKWAMQDGERPLAATLAAKWRVETDPLVPFVHNLAPSMTLAWAENAVRCIRAALAEMEGKP